MATSNYTGLDIAFTGVPQRTPTRMRLDVLTKALDNVARRHYDALDTRNALELGLSQLDLNNADDAYKANLIRSTIAKIDAKAQGGNYSDTLSYARQLAADTMSDPELNARVKLNQQYQKQRQDIEKANIPSVRKQRWIEQNPYDFEKFANRDELGNFIGSSDFTPDWTPAAPTDMTKIYGLLKQLVAPEAGGGENVQFLDENGNLTTDASKGFFGMAVKRGSKWERVTEDRLKSAFNALFNQYPEAMESLMQDMDDRRWEYDKADDEGKKAFLGSDIMDGKGEFYSPEQYLAKRVDPVLHEMAYNHVESSIDYGDAYAKRLKYLDDAKKLGGALGGFGGLDFSNQYPDLMSDALGTPMEITMEDKAASSYNTLATGIKNVGQLSPTLAASDSFKKAVRENRFSDIADMINRDKNISVADKGSLVRMFKKEGDVFTKLTNGLTKDAAEALMFKAAFDSGAPLPDDNKYSEEYSNIKNSLFNYNDINTRTVKTGDSIGITFQDETQKGNIIAYLNAAGIYSQDYAKNGIKLTKSNGREELRITKDSPILSKVADAFLINPDRTWSFHSSYVTSYSNDTPVTPVGQALQSPKSLFLSLSSSGNVSQNAEINAKRAYELNPNAKAVLTLTSGPYSDINVKVFDDLQRQGVLGYTDAEAERHRKQIDASNYDAAQKAMQHPNNFAIWGKEQDTGVLKRMSQKDVDGIRATILNAFAENRVDLSFDTMPTASGYGTRLYIRPKENAKGEVIRKGNEFYVDGLLVNQASKAVANDPVASAKRSYQLDRAIGTAVENVLGNLIDYNSPNAINEYIGSIAYNDILSDLDSDISNLGENKSRSDVLSRENAILLAAKLAEMSGYGRDETVIQSVANRLLDYVNKP